MENEWQIVRAITGVTIMIEIIDEWTKNIFWSFQGH